MKGRRGRLTDADLIVWRAVAATVERRMPGARLPPGPPPAPPPPAAQGALGPAAPPAPRPPPAAKPRPLDIERPLRRKLASGRLHPEDRLDLHGFRQAEAHDRLAGFVRQAHRDGKKLVLVITGKGRDGEHPLMQERGVLRRLVPLWLAEPRLAPFVLAVGEAARQHGGDGALYVRLRGRPRSG